MESDVRNSYHDVEENQLHGGSVYDVAMSKVRFRKHKKKHNSVHKSLQKRLSSFELSYFKLGNELIPETKNIDYVLVHSTRSSLKTDDKKKLEEFEEREKLRELFEKELLLEGFTVEKEEHDDFVFKMLQCPFKRLCAEAEMVKLEMPLKDCQNYKDKENWWADVLKIFETDDEVDYVSAPFLMDRIHLYEKYEDPTYFFRQAQRSLLTHHILINLDIRKRVKIEESFLEKYEKEEREEDCLSKIMDRLCCKQNKPSVDEQMDGSEHKETQQSEHNKNKVLCRMGLPFLMMEKVYIDAFVSHEESEKSSAKEEIKHIPETTPRKRPMDKKGDNPHCYDPRGAMDETWSVFWKFQPLWMIRNYFGEKIALYFAWTGTLTTTLWLPSIFGIVIFLYGLTLSIQRMGVEETSNALEPNATLAQEIKMAVTNLLDVIKESFDNDVTPFFALVICLWGTVFLELWKRKNATLAYEWDVEDFELNEPDRPEFYGTKVKKDPVTEENNWIYPVKRQMLKLLFSTSSLLLMVCLVLISVAAVIVYRVIVSVNYCPGMTSTECLLTTTIISSLLNAISILLLGKVYDVFAKKLTEWENHRTQTQHDDALIIKLFAFQFANSYASCFYIAFFRGKLGYLGFFGLGDEYTDDCNGSCMSQLSFQVLILMLVKPFPKLIQDILIPWCQKYFRNIKCAFCSRCCLSRKIKSDEESLQHEHNGDIQYTFLEKEKMKLSLGDFTLGEYTEKIIQYGFLMLFAASFPLAPLLALLTNLFDIRVDAKRLLWWYRRPVAFIAQDIGMWYGILNFVNLCGVISNGFLIAFTSTWASQYDVVSKLWIVIIFEHVVLTLKFVLAYLIPDIPAEVDLAIRRERYQITKKLNEGLKRSGALGFANLVPDDKRTVTHKSNNRSAGSAPGGAGDGGTTIPQVTKPEHEGVKSGQIATDQDKERPVGHVEKQEQDQAIMSSTLGKISPSEQTVPPTQVFVVEEKRKPKKRRSSRKSMDRGDSILGLQPGSEKPRKLNHMNLHVTTTEETVPEDTEHHVEQQ